MPPILSGPGQENQVSLICSEKSSGQVGGSRPLNSDIVRVLIVDDHEIMREGLRRIFERDRTIEVVGEAGSGEEAIAVAGKIMPDVITMDIKMPGMDGIRATRELKRLLPAAKVVMVTLFSDDYVRDSIEAGASGFVLKDSEAEVIIESVHQAHEGYYPISPSLTKDIIAQYAQLLTTSREKVLTERQLEILKLISQGLSSKEIGEKLFISPSTAKREINLIIDKLGASDRAEAVSRAIQRRLI
jgi:two-component system NarL family response regulator